MKVAAIVLAAALAMTGAPPPANAAEPTASALIKRWREANEICRGSSPVTAYVQAVCDEREAIGRQIDTMNWCYGRRGEYQYQKDWHRCGPRSIREGQPDD
ncbi:hypothetical protein [Chelatococcus reniformis]|uniref:DUF1311 domain-containing protein n=1 Tax=Chelatococcus reniformis TaxID=1494448 RepID=A0A916V0L9_9HYPH|nr:hypothetical protein [Chelatococcus reniformis]GGC94755.1 hypothetical protein GCM10010994_60610 [Chelatococcus reniformis]